jgi:hypothetical protein
MYSVYQHWDPLKVCVVGRAYPPQFYSWIKDPDTREKFEKVAIETEEDFQKLIHLLEKFDVEVLRPTIPDSFEDCLVDGVWVPPPVTPRDYFIQIHDKLWLPTVPNANHAYNAFRKQKSLSWEEFASRDQRKHDRKLKFYSEILSQCDVMETENTYISGCFVSRIGKDLFFATQTIFDDWDVILDDVNKLFPDTNNHIVDAQGHGDAVYCPVAPGLIISIAEEDYTNSFPDWEVVHLPKSHYAAHKMFQASMKLNAGKWYIPGFEENPLILETVNTYFDDWIGEVSETVFGVNILIIDPSNVVVSEHNTQVEQACAGRGITVHVVPFRHKYFWDAGIHCVTNDLHRQGTLGKHLQ